MNNMDEKVSMINLTARMKTFPLTLSNVASTIVLNEPHEGKNEENVENKKFAGSKECKIMVLVFCTFSHLHLFLYQV